jgi:hypothetical protein
MENYLAMLFVVIATSMHRVASLDDTRDAFQSSVRFAAGFPLILTGIYYSLWAVRDAEWRADTAKQKNAESGPRE